jgi:type III pantothenate kinase
VTNTARRAVRSIWPLPWFDLTAQTARCRLGIRYPKPETIGPDRLANAIAARHHFGAPCLAIDFGTAVTFDAIDDTGSFVGGIIAPGVSLMTRYLHDQTALLPEVRLRPVRGGIGRSTEQAMLIAATYGFAGMVQALILQAKRHLARRRLPVVATGGYARQIARRLPEITAVVPHLTLEGLRLAWHLGLESPAAAPTLRSHESH